MIGKKFSYISLQEATNYCNYSQEYLSLRARQGKLRAVKFGRNWVTKKEWLDDYLKRVVEFNNNRSNGRRRAKKLPKNKKGIFEKAITQKRTKQKRNVIGRPVLIPKKSAFQLVPLRATLVAAALCLISASLVFISNPIIVRDFYNNFYNNTTFFVSSFSIKLLSGISSANQEFDYNTELLRNFIGKRTIEIIQKLFYVSDSTVKLSKLVLKKTKDYFVKFVSPGTAVAVLEKISQEKIRRNPFLTIRRFFGKLSREFIQYTLEDAQTAKQIVKTFSEVVNLKTGKTKKSLKEAVSKFVLNFKIKTNLFVQELRKLTDDLVFTVREIPREIVQIFEKKLKKHPEKLLTESSPKPAKEGLVVIPSTNKDEEIKEKIKASFSDEVKIIQKDKDSGIIIPIFREKKGSEYFYLLVPVK
jgi:hypothetical protein